jgi:uncharacterized membrane protein
MIMESRTKSAVLLASAVAGLLAIGAVATDVQAAEGKVKCYGVNECKGHGACAGAGNGCGGKNACKGQGFVEVESEKACLDMKGGRLTPSK